RRRDRIGLPLHVAGFWIERGDPIAQAAIAAGAADDDRILQRQRRGGEFKVRLVEHILVPDDLAGLLVGCNYAGVVARDRDDQIAPKRDATIAVLILQVWVHLPQDRAGGAGADVDLGDHTPAIDHVHETIVDKRRGFEAFAGRLT